MPGGAVITIDGGPNVTANIPGTHLVRVTMLFKELGENGLVVDPSVYEMRDEAGVWQPMLGDNNQFPPSGCSQPEQSQSRLGPGQTFGPLSFCFDVTGPVDSGAQLIIGSGCPDDLTGRLPVVPPEGIIYTQGVTGGACSSALVGFAP